MTSSAPALAIAWRGEVAGDELAALSAGAMTPAWWERVSPHALGWVTARLAGALVGFVNVAWDGDRHAFLLDTTTHPDHRRQRIGGAVVEAAVREAGRAGCEWVHVDFEQRLAAFYLDACGFAPTAAGLIRLSPPSD